MELSQSTVICVFVFFTTVYSAPRAPSFGLFQNDGRAPSALASSFSTQTKSLGPVQLSSRGLGSLTFAPSSYPSNPLSQGGYNYDPPQVQCFPSGPPSPYDPPAPFPYYPSGPSPYDPPAPSPYDPPMPSPFGPPVPSPFGPPGPWPYEPPMPSPFGPPGPSPYGPPLPSPYGPPGPSPFFPPAPLPIDPPVPSPYGPPAPSPFDLSGQSGAGSLAPYGAQMSPFQASPFSTASHMISSVPTISTYSSPQLISKTINSTPLTYQSPPTIYPSQSYSSQAYDTQPYGAQSFSSQSSGSSPFGPSFGQSPASSGYLQYRNLPSDSSTSFTADSGASLASPRLTSVFSPDDSSNPFQRRSKESSPSSEPATTRELFSRQVPSSVDPKAQKSAA